MHTDENKCTESWALVAFLIVRFYLRQAAIYSIHVSFVTSIHPRLDLWRHQHDQSGAVKPLDSDNRLQFMSTKHKVRWHMPLRASGNKTSQAEVLSSKPPKYWCLGNMISSHTYDIAPPKAERTAQGVVYWKAWSSMCYHFFCRQMVNRKANRTSTDRHV